jgi:hypothetical protein
MAKEQAAATAAAGGIVGMSSEDYHNEFYNTGRIGRRNAMPDILGQHSTTTTADLPDALGAMSTQGEFYIEQTILSRFVSVSTHELTVDL